MCITAEINNLWLNVLFNRMAAVIVSTMERRKSDTERAGLSYLNMIDKNSYVEFLYRSCKQTK